jgi:hypothetical protein
MIYKNVGVRPEELGISLGNASVKVDGPGKNAKMVALYPSFD